MLLSVVFSTCSTITRKKKDSKNLIDFSSLDLLFGAASNYFILRQPLFLLLKHVKFYIIRKVVILVSDTKEKDYVQGK